MNQSQRQSPLFSVASRRSCYSALMADATTTARDAAAEVAAEPGPGPGGGQGGGGSKSATGTPSAKYPPRYPLTGRVFDLTKKSCGRCWLPRIATEYWERACNCREPLRLIAREVIMDGERRWECPKCEEAYLTGGWLCLHVQRCNGHVAPFAEFARATWSSWGGP